MAPKKPPREYEVFWHNIKVAELRGNTDGTWHYEREPGAIQIETNPDIRADGLPKYIAALLPEAGQNEFDDIRSIGDAGARLLSSIALVKKGDPPKLRGDRLYGSLDDFGKNHIFQGSMDLVPQLRNDTGREYSEEFLATFMHREIPRMSGVNAKLPMYLAEDGSFRPSINCPFTHILKVPGTEGTNNLLPTMEQYGMLILNAIGIPTEKFCHGTDKRTGINYFIAERFDISSDPSMMIVAEDMGSVMGYANAQKFDPSMLDVCRAVMDTVTNPDYSGQVMFAQIVASRLMLNTDLHVKNLSIIKRANETRSGFDIVSLSPAYDVTVGVGIIHEDYARKMALHVGDTEEYGVKELDLIAKACGLTTTAGRHLMKEMAARIGGVAEPLSRAVLAGKTARRYLDNAAVGIKDECTWLLDELQRTATSRPRVTF